jgi:hypothetical protein
MPTHFLNADKFGIETDVRESDDSPIIAISHEGITQIASSSLNYFAIFKQDQKNGFCSPP